MFLWSFHLVASDVIYINWDRGSFIPSMWIPEWWVCALTFEMGRLIRRHSIVNVRRHSKWNIMKNLEFDHRVLFLPHYYFNIEYDCEIWSCTHIWWLFSRDSSSITSNPAANRIVPHMYALILASNHPFPIYWVTLRCTHSVDKKHCCVCVCVCVCACRIHVVNVIPSQHASVWELCVKRQKCSWALWWNAESMWRTTNRKHI